MPTPALLVTIPILAAAIAYTIRRWSVATIIVGCLTLLLLVVAVFATDSVGGSQQMAIDSFWRNSWGLFGRTLILTDQIRTALLVVYTGFGLLFLLSTTFPQDSIFVPVSLGVLAPLAGLLMVQPSTLGVAMLLSAAGLMAVLIQGERTDSTAAAIRYLALVAIAVPLLLIAGWMTSVGQLRFLSATIILLSISILILLVAFPFLFWVPEAVDDSGSLVPVIVFGLVTLLVAVFIVTLLVVNPVIYANAQFLSILRVSGTVTIFIAGILVLTTRTAGRLLSYLLLLDVGATVIALSNGGRTALETLLLFILLRSVSLLLAGAGLDRIRKIIVLSPAGDKQLADYRGLARRSPLGLALFVFGGLSLAGFPLTPGFAGRWMVINSPAEFVESSTIIFVLSAAVGIIGILRLLRVSLKPASETDVTTSKETKVLRIIEGLLLGAGLIVTIFPRILAVVSRSLANPF